MIAILSTFRRQWLALGLLVLFALLLMGGVALYVERSLYKAVLQSNESGAALQRHLQAEVWRSQLSSHIEKWEAATLAKDPARAQQALTAAQASSKAMLDAFALNKADQSLPSELRAEAARIDEAARVLAQSTQEWLGTNPEDAAAFSQKKAALEAQFFALGKDVGALRERLQEAVASAATLGALAADRAQTLVWLAPSVMVLLILALLLVFYQQFAGKMRQISQVIDAVNLGQSNARTQMSGPDELSELGRAFDRLLDERFASIEKAARENEALNNSVIALLQTVFQLSNRDLTARAPVTEDIIGTVASSINQFSDEASRTLSEVQRIAQQVTETSESLRLHSMTVEKTARAERDALDAMSDNLSETTSHLAKVAQLSDQSSRVAGAAAEATNNALVAVQGTVQGMDQLRDSISDMEKRFKRLGERSQEISTAVQLINAISERTHVLALNASMQAATAGEAGRGFAVVAEEVQRLSDSSRQATATISQLVGNIQAETNETLFTVNRLIGSVVRQSELAQHAGTQMNQTQQTTQQLVNLVRQIAQFSEQQTALATSLQQSVLDINAGTEQTSSAIAAQSASTQALAQSSQQLAQTVSLFKLA